ncbi:hypothetical protein DFR76_110359 [Nocardia pseudobrasiliensis]|uniref:Uncharacterized protein n=1 Tax=Nocardia pseudobrasiliensis TaxID=45979 RepID=A0A370HYR4_9NOCA|nr:hypothetical protein DFR76_110359 [Nocardia pseudobrasiliensis]
MPHRRDRHAENAPPPCRKRRSATAPDTPTPPRIDPPHRYRNITPKPKRPVTTVLDTPAAATGSPRHRYRKRQFQAGNPNPLRPGILRRLPGAPLDIASETPLPRPKTVARYRPGRPTTAAGGPGYRSRKRHLPMPETAVHYTRDATRRARDGRSLPSRVLRWLPRAALDVVTALRLLLWLLLWLVGLRRLVLGWLSLADSGLLAQVSL